MQPSSSLHLPHWLTSNNSDMDSSEVSVPRLKYPPWVQCCDVSEPDGASETELWDRHGTAIPYYCVILHPTIEAF